MKSATRLSVRCLLLMVVAIPSPALAAQTEAPEGDGLWWALPAIAAMVVLGLAMVVLSFHHRRNRRTKLDGRLPEAPDDPTVAPPEDQPVVVTAKPRSRSHADNRAGIERLARQSPRPEIAELDADPWA